MATPSRLNQFAAQFAARFALRFVLRLALAVGIACQSILVPGGALSSAAARTTTAPAAAPLAAAPYSGPYSGPYRDPIGGEPLSPGEAITESQLFTPTTPVAPFTLYVPQLAKFSDGAPLVLALNEPDRDRVLNGQELTMTLLLKTNPQRRNITATVSLPPGLDYVAGSAQGATYVTATRRLVWRNLAGSPSGQGARLYRLRVNDPGAPADRVISADLDCLIFCTSDVAPAVIHIGKPKVGQVGSAGGRFDLLNGRVAMTFAPGALSRTLAITGVEYATTTVQAGAEGTAVLFDAYPDVTFNAPVTIAINLKSLATVTGAYGAERWPVLQYLARRSITQTVEITKGLRVVVTSTPLVANEMESQFDPATGMLVAQLQHFSSYQAGVQHSTPTAWKFNTRLGNVSLFRGSVEFEYPLSVPPMQDGLAPGLALKYSSASADQYDGIKPPSPSPGIGWSLDTPVITRRVKREVVIRNEYVDIQDGNPYSCEGYLVQNGWCRIWYPVPVIVGHYANDFTLSMGGNNYNLVANPAAPGEYVTEQYAPLRIRRCNTQTPCSAPSDQFPSVTNATGEYWQVWTADGTRYVFGVDQRSEQLIKLDYNPARVSAADYAGAAKDVIADAWHLHSVYALHRDDVKALRWSALYEYIEETKDGSDIETRLAAVHYGNNLAPDRFHVIIDYVAPWPDVRQPMKVRVLREHQYSAATLWQYALSYDAYQRLTRVEQLVWNGRAWVSLPGMSFAYQTVDNRTLLTRVANNYGAEQKYSYVKDSRNGHRVELVTTTTRNGAANGAASGAATSWTGLLAYSYAGPCYNETNSPCATGHDWQPSGALMGYATVVESARDPSGAVLGASQHRFYTDRKRLGREYESSALNTALNNGLTLQQTEYAVLEGAAWDLPAGAWFVAPITVTSYPNSGAAFATDTFKRLVTRYDRALQGGRFYGQATGAREYDGARLTKVSTTTFALYTPNWVLRPTQETIADPSGARLSELRYFYDGLPGGIIFGDLTFVQQVAPVGGVDRTRDVAIQYDAAGNKNAETVFDDYGTPGVMNTASRPGATSRFAYDGDFAQFPVQWIDPLGRTTRVEYYGVNNVPLLNGLPSSVGLTKREIGPNGDATATSYSYDAFGRLTAVARPGDTLALPTVSYAYSDTPVTTTVNFSVTQVVVTTRQRPQTGPQSGAAFTYASAELYDGLGHLLQTKVQTQTNGPAGASTIASYTRYDAAGRAVEQSVPVAGGANLAALDAVAWPSLPRARTGFDNLGRTVIVTAADGTTAQTAYDRYSVATLDAQGHLKLSSADALGRLAAARDYTGTFAAPTLSPCGAGQSAQACAYASTTYGYDAADRLVAVTDTLGNRTVITYNALGEKIAMNDPDMGVWSYRYDPRGRLVAQTDARGRTLGFSYDVLGRVVQKFEIGIQKADVLATFGYDEGGAAAYAIGQRTSMTDTTGVTRWQYDARGRALRETRLVGIFDASQARGITGTYVMERGYDNLDRPVWVKYPDGEVVTTTYGAQGPLTLASSLAASPGQPGTLVASADYNTFGQLTRLRLGNGLTTRYGYYGYAGYAGLLGSGSGLDNADTARFGRLARLCTLVSVVGDAAAAQECARPDTATPQSLAYEYDAVGNITALTDYANPSSGTAQGTIPQVQRFTYDALDRLSTAEAMGAGQGQYRQAWQYNAVGNIVARSRQGDPVWFSRGWAGITETYQYQSPRPHAVSAVVPNAGGGSPAGTATFAAQYDANGNMTARVELSGTRRITYTQEWDAENRLIAVTTVDGTTVEVERYVYNADGERVARIGPRGSTLYVGELYEEEWPADGAAGLRTPALAEAQPGPQADAQPPASPQTKMIYKPLGPEAAEGWFPYYSADFSQPLDPSHWTDSSDVAMPQDVMDCHTNQRLFYSNGNYSHQDAEGWHTSSSSSQRVDKLYSNNVIPPTGAVSLTLLVRWEKPSYAGRPPSNDPVGVFLSSVPIIRYFYTPSGLFGPADLCYQMDRMGGEDTFNSVGQNFSDWTWGTITLIYLPETDEIAYYVDGMYRSTYVNVLRPTGITFGSHQFADNRLWEDFVVRAMWVAWRPVDVPVMAPLGRYTRGTTNTVSWTYTPINGMTGYQVVVSADSAFTWPYTQTVSASTTSFTFNGRLDGVTYWYRVRAIGNSGAATEWSNVVYSTQDASDPTFSNFQPGGWVGASPRITITLKDNTSGLRNTVWYTLDGGAWISTTQGYPEGTLLPQTVSIPTTLNTSGAHTARFAVCDIAWRCGYSSIYSVSVDVDTPVFGVFQPTGWVGVAGGVYITMEVRDALSGLRATGVVYTTPAGYAGISNTIPDGYTGLVQARALTPITRTATTPVRFRACDMIGNCAWSTIQTLRSDGTPPTLISPTLRLSAFWSPNGDGRNDVLTATLGASDANAGLKQWQAAIYTGTRAVYTFPVQTNWPITLALNCAAYAGLCNLADRDYELVITATDQVGNVSRAGGGNPVKFNQIHLDRQAPSSTWPYLVLKPYTLADWPAGTREMVNVNQAPVRGVITTAVDRSSVGRIWVNGITAVTGTLKENQIYTGMVSLNLGANPITVTLEDFAGNRVNLTRTLDFTTAGPALDAWAPVGVLTRSGLITLTGRLNPNIVARVLSATVTELRSGVIAQAVVTQSSELTFTAPVTLAGGNRREYEARVGLQALGGTSATTATWRFAIDTLAAVAIVRPGQGSLINRASVDVTVQGDSFGDADGKAQLWVNGQSAGEAPTDGNAAYTWHGVSLPSGLVTLSVRLTDSVRNTAAASQTVTVDLNAVTADVSAEPATIAPGVAGGYPQSILQVNAYAPAASLWRIKDWWLAISPLAGGTTRVWNGTTDAPEFVQAIAWDGADSASVVRDGAYEARLTVTATNGTLTSTRVSATALITVDRSAPGTPVIVSPKGAQYSSLHVMTGTGAPGTNVVVYRDGVTLTHAVGTVGISGTWALPEVQLQVGGNGFRARAQGPNGLWSPASALVTTTLLVIPPLISVTIQPERVGLNRPLLSLALARGAPLAFPTKLVTIQPLTQTMWLGQNITGPYTSTWRLLSNANSSWCVELICDREVTFVGVDMGNNRGEGKASVIIDGLRPAPPQWAIPTDPASTIYTNIVKFDLAGTAYGLSRVEIRRGAATVATTNADANRKFATSVTLVPGTNTLCAVAIDDVGNTSDPTAQCLNVVYDTAPPAITQAGAQPAFVQRFQFYTISAVITDMSPLGDVMARVNVPASSLGSFQMWPNGGNLYQAAPGMVDVDGPYTVTIEVADAAGNVARSETVLVVDSQAPAVALVSLLTGNSPYAWTAMSPTPTVWYGAGNGTVTVTARATDTLAGLQSVTFPDLTSAGTVAPMGEQTTAQIGWTYTFAAGSTLSGTYMVVATDRALNTNTTPLRVLNDVTPPALSIAAPEHTIDGEAELTLSTSDADSGLRGVDVVIVEGGITPTRLLTNAPVGNTALRVSGLNPLSWYRWVVTATDNVNNRAVRTAETAAVVTTKTYYFGAMRVAVRSSSQSAVASSQIVWLHSDHLSSVSAATSVTGTVVSRQLFGPYGELRYSWDTSAQAAEQRWGWATQRAAEGNGLIFMRARWYSVYVGRFVSPDPVPDGAGTGVSFARYDYGRGNPVRYNDPTGHDVGCGRPDASECGAIFRSAQMRAMGISMKLLDTLAPTQMSVPTATPSPTQAPLPTQEVAASQTGQPATEPTAQSTTTLTDKWISPFGEGTNYQVTWAFDYASQGLDQHDPTIHDGIDLVSANDSDNDVENSRGVYAVHDLIFEWLGDDTNIDTQGLLNVYYYDLQGEKVWLQYTHVKVTDTSILNGVTGKTVIPRGTKIGYYGPYGHYNDFIHLHITVKQGKAKEHRDNLKNPQDYLPS